MTVAPNKYYVYSDCRSEIYDFDTMEKARNCALRFLDIDETEQVLILECIGKYTAETTTVVTFTEPEKE
jgi:hypothetical protein